MATVVDWRAGALPAGGTTAGTVTLAPSGQGYDVAQFALSGTADYLRWDTAAVARFTARTYIRLPASWATGATDVFRSQIAGAAITSRMALSGSSDPGRFRWVRASSVQVANSAFNGLLPGQTYRIEVQIDTVAASIRGGLFRPGTDTPEFDSGLISGDVGAAATRFLFGKPTLNATLAAFEMSRIKIVDTVGAWVGRDTASDPLPPAGTELLGTWSGAALHPVELVGIWNGASILPVEPL